MTSIAGCTFASSASRIRMSWQICSTAAIEANLEKVVGRCRWPQPSKGLAGSRCRRASAIMRREGEPVDCAAQDLRGSRSSASIRQQARRHASESGFSPAPTPSGFPKDSRVHNTSAYWWTRIGARLQRRPTARSTSLTSTSKVNTAAAVFRESARTTSPGNPRSSSQTPPLDACGAVDLLRPALPGALSTSTRAAGARLPLRAQRLRPRHRAVITGRCCCARERSRTRPLSSHPPSGDRSRTQPQPVTGAALVVDPWGVVLATASDAPRRRRHVVGLRPRRSQRPVARGASPPSPTEGSSQPARASDSPSSGACGSRRACR